jgi:alkanesulfonate monooxygenase SsuD/methylene tetrahydromethanopterin reductase-like flavin-dependent oxidoreductase (luciferase family)
VQLGVRGPKSLLLSGRCADGTILAEGAAPGYIRWAQEQIAAGQAQVGRDDPHRLTVYVWTSIGEARESARALVRPTLASTLPYVHMQLEPAGLAQEVAEALKKSTPQELALEMPEHWMDALTVSGTVEDCAAAVGRFMEAGVDSLVFVLPFEEEAAQLQRLEEQLLPRIWGD